MQAKLSQIFHLKAKEKIEKTKSEKPEPKQDPAQKLIGKRENMNSGEHGSFNRNEINQLSNEYPENNFLAKPEKLICPKPVIHHHENFRPMMHSETNDSVSKLARYMASQSLSNLTQKMTNYILMPTPGMR